ncbi:MAG: hypothetical protein R6U37_06135 [Dehalococcoidia bacterium]
MKHPASRKRKYWFRAGVFLLFGSALFWVSHIIAMANNLSAWDEALLSAVVVTAIPAGIGVYGIWYGKKDM